MGCLEGELRLSEVACSDVDGFLIEECTAGTWTESGGCSEPSTECTGNESEVVPTEELCGDAFFNQQVQHCRGGLFQLGCACGTADPQSSVPGSHYEVNDDGQVLNMEGVVYPDELFLGSFGYTTNLSQVLCVGQLYTYGSPIDMAGLVGATEVISDDRRAFSEGSPIETEMDLSLLSAIGFLEIFQWPEDDLGALSGVKELRDLYVGCGYTLEEFCPTLESLKGLEGVRDLDSGIIEAPALVDLTGLDGLIEVRGSFSVFASRRTETAKSYDFELTSLQGLDSLQRVGGDLHLPIMDRKDIDVLSKLESVGGTLALEVQDEDLVCATSDWVQGLKVDGDISLNQQPIESFDCE